VRGRVVEGRANNVRERGGVEEEEDAPTHTHPHMCSVDSDEVNIHMRTVEVLIKSKTFTYAKGV